MLPSRSERFGGDLEGAPDISRDRAGFRPVRDASRRRGHESVIRLPSKENLMNRATILCFVLAACERSPSTAPTRASEPADVVAGEAPPADLVVDDDPAAAPPTFASRLNQTPWATGKQLDATSLGSDVELYLVERAGGFHAGHGDAQDKDLALVVVGTGGVLRVALAEISVPAFDGLAPFGELEAVAPPSKPRKYDQEQDGFSDAPRFKSKSPVLLSKAVHSYPDEDQLRFVVTREGDTVVVWFAGYVWEEGPSKRWEKQVTVELAAGATVDTPIASTAIGTPTGPVAVEMIERIARQNDGFSVEFDLRVGDRVGPIGDCWIPASLESLTPGERTWPMHAPAIAADAIATRAPELAPLDTTGVVLAHRICQESAGYTSRFYVERAGEEIVVWKRTDKQGEPADPWDLRVRVPLPAATKIAAR